MKLIDVFPPEVRANPVPGESSRFPLQDRNPQSIVANIAMAKPGDFRAATQQVWFPPSQASFVGLPVVAATP